MYSMYSMIAWLYHIGGGRRTYAPAVCFDFFLVQRLFILIVLVVLYFLMDKFDCC